MNSNENQAGKVLKLKRIILPLIIGLAVVIWLFAKAIDFDQLKTIDWRSPDFSLWILIALGTNLFRALGYIWRIRLLTDGELSWRKSFEVIMLWEFASAVTPGIVGGSAVAIFLLMREGIVFGKSTAIVLLTTFLDELVFVAAVPVLYLVLGESLIFSNTTCAEAESLTVLNYTDNLSMIVLAIYAILVVVTVLLWLGLFVNPGKINTLFISLSKLKMLKSKREKIAASGKDLLTTAAEFSTKTSRFWLLAITATLIAWFSRYALANCLIMAVQPDTSVQLLAFGRQYIIWMMALLPTTPGGSGVAEISFLAFMCEFIPNGLSPTVMLLWRLLSYYLYILIGAIVLPRWLSRVMRP